MWSMQKSKKFLSPTISRKFILKKYVLQAMGPLRGKRVIEFGCGNGHWLRQFHAAGGQCTGIDISKDQIELAKKLSPKGIVYLTGDVAALGPRDKFDVVYVDHVLSETKSLEKAIHILRRAHAILKKEGRLVISEMHPSVAHFPSGAHVGKDFFYFKSGAPVAFKVKQISGHRILIRDYHWTMHDFSSALKKSGFLIEEILEPRAPKAVSDPYTKSRYGFPTHILIKAIPRGNFKPKI
ncbi:MAG: class I SAM-dependent methyltransferase [Patescibacteria group bacterium]